MISRQYQSIFVHIPKTAGTSIEFALGHFQTLRWGVQDHRSIREIEPLSVQDLLRMPWRRAEMFFLLKRLRSQMIGRPTVSAQHYHDYFKFTFVRNPWARTFSWYRNVMRDVRHQQRYGIPAGCSFPDFIHRYLNPARGPMRPQLYWILDKNSKVSLDYIGRFEQLTRDFRHVCERINLPFDELPRMISAEESMCYIDSYDQAMIDVIATVYAPEIKMFGYSFGDGVVL